MPGGFKKLTKRGGSTNWPQGGPMWDQWEPIGTNRDPLCAIREPMGSIFAPIGNQWAARKRQNPIETAWFLGFYWVALGWILMPIWVIILTLGGSRIPFRVFGAQVLRCVFCVQGPYISGFPACGFFRGFLELAHARWF